MIDTLSTIVDSTGTVINLTQHPILLTVLGVVLTSVIFGISIFMIIKKLNSKKLIEIQYVIQVILDALSDGSISTAELQEILMNIQKLFILNSLTTNEICTTILQRVHQLRLVKQDIKPKKI